MRRGAALPVALIAGGALLGAPRAGGAQMPTLPRVASQRVPEADSGCMSTLTAGDLHEVPVYLEAFGTDSISRNFLPNVDLLVDAAARRIRGMLVDSAGVSRSAASLLSWRDLGLATAVTLYRDGRFTWRRLDDTLLDDSVAADGLLERTLAALWAEGERGALPTDGPDSIRVRIAYRTPTVAEDGTLQPLAARLALPLFRLGIPFESPVVVRRPPHVTYPSAAAGRAIGTVVLQFVVGVDGRVDSRTIREVDVPTLAFEAQQQYRGFLAAVRSGLAYARYEPARIGRCKVRQLVQQPFEFSMRD